MDDGSTECPGEPTETRALESALERSKVQIGYWKPTVVPRRERNAQLCIFSVFSVYFQCIFRLEFAEASRDATLAALRKRHADAVGRDADRSPVLRKETQRVSQHI